MGGALTLLTARSSEARGTMALPSNMVAGGTRWAAATLGTGLSKPATWAGCRKGRIRQAFLEVDGWEP